MHSTKVCIASKHRKIIKITASPYSKAISISGKREGFLHGLPQRIAKSTLYVDQYIHVRNSRSVPNKNFEFFLFLSVGNTQSTD
jgi:hypothetical protein